MKIRKKSNNLYFIMLLLSILPFNYATLTLNKFSTIVTILIYLIRSYLVIYVMMYLKNNKLDQEEKHTLKNVSLYFLFIFFLNIISTLISADFSFKTLILRTFSMLYMYGFYVYIIFNFKNIDNFHKITKRVCVFLMLYSLILYFLFPAIGRFYEGYNSYALIGVATNRNSIFELLSPIIVTIFFNDNGKIKLSDIFIILLVFITLYLSKSVTGILSFLVMMFMIFISRYEFKKINIYKLFMILFIIIWVLYILIICFNVDLSIISSSFSNKSTTLSGRTIIWQKALYFIKRNPLVGYGYDNSIIGTIANYDIQNGTVFPNDTHNGILFLLLSSGIIGTTVLLIFIIRTLKKGIKVIICKRKYSIIFIFLLSNIFRGLTESCFHYSHLFFFLYLIITNIEYNKIYLKDK